MSGAVMLVMALLPGIPMIPFLALGSGAAALAFIIDRRTIAHRGERGAQGGSRRQDRGRRRADLDRAAHGRPQGRDRLRAAAAGQRGRRQRPADRADQGAAPLARGRDGLRDAGGAHPRQRAARGQRLCHQDQGGRGRRRQDLGRAIHGHGPGRRPGEDAGHPHHRADLRPAGDLDRRRAQGRGLAQGLHRGRRRHRACPPISPNCSRATWRSFCPTPRCRSC